jgi:hypothetical protein
MSTDIKHHIKVGVQENMSGRGPGNWSNVATDSELDESRKWEQLGPRRDK